MKRKLLLVYVFVAIVLLCNNVYAAITMDLELNSDKKTVNPGDELDVTVNLKNISAPIASIEKGFIDIDEGLIEGITKDVIATNSNGRIEVKSGSTTSELTYVVNPSKNNGEALDAEYDVVFNTKNEDFLEGHDCLFVMDFKSDIQGNAEVLGFKFKVKESATIKEVKDAVKVEFAELYSTKDTVTPVSANLDIKVEKKAEAPTEDNTVDENKVPENKVEENQTPAENKDNNTDKNNDKNTNTNTNSNTNTNKNNTKNNTNTNSNKVANNTNTDGTVAGTKIPAAGAKMIIIPVLIFAVLGYISYNKYLKYKDI